MKEIIKFIKDMVMNPDGKSYSSKRMGGWIALFTYIGFGIFNKQEHIVYATLGLVVSFFGLTSLDYSQFLKNKNQETL
jgi:hypothetical protein